MTQSPRTGFFATLCAFLAAQGSGAPLARAGRRAAVLAAALVLAALAVALPVTPALAAGSPHAGLELAAVPAASLGCEAPQFVPELKYDEVFATRAHIVATVRIGNTLNLTLKSSGAANTLPAKSCWTKARGRSPAAKRSPVTRLPSASGLTTVLRVVALEP